MRFYCLQLLLLIVARGSAYGQGIPPVNVKEDTTYTVPAGNVGVSLTGPVPTIINQRYQLDPAPLSAGEIKPYKVNAELLSAGEIKPYKVNAELLSTGEIKPNKVNAELLSTDEIKPYRVNPGPLLAAGIMIGYGVATFHVRPLHDLDLSAKAGIHMEDPRFHTTIDNYLQYSPIFGVYALNAIGIHGAHNFKDRTIILGISSLLVCGTVTGLKTLTHRERPDGSAANSFPSGHTATAFMSAEFMRMEYKDVSPWIAVGGYMAATATGVLRMYNNRHWLSDVVAGAGVGILSTQAAFWLYPKIQKGFTGKGNTSTMVVPTYDAGTKSAGLSLLYVH